MSPTLFPRIRRDLSRIGLGVVQLATRARTKREHERRVVVFNDLVDDSQVDVLRALLDGRVSWEELIAARRRNELAGPKILATVAAERALFTDAIPSTLPKMGKAKGTRARYKLSLTQLERQTVVPWPRVPMRVRDLVSLDWATLAERWPNSDGDWNNLVRAVSRFLSLNLGNKHAPFRLEVMGLIPQKATEGRVPDLSLELFETILVNAPEHVRPAYYTLLLTGMRVRTEYLRCGAEHLMPATTQIRVPGTKTKKSKATVAVHPESWPWIVAGIPSPLRYGWLRKYWNQACLASGAAQMVPDPKRPGKERYVGLTMHDLRHALAQWTSDAGTPVNKVQDMLRHASPAMTAKYARQTATRTVAKTISDIIQRRPA